MPYGGSCGALDMVNLGHIVTFPPRYAPRLLYMLIPQLTLTLTTLD
ncbi:hypothetical protein [Burkholderia thailandensis]